jgi:hypothetical protein
MAIETVSDLFAAGADFEAEQFVLGTVTRYDTLVDLLRNNFGAELAASPETIRQFETIVRQATRSADLISAGELSGLDLVPFRSGDSGTGKYNQRGYVIVSVSDPETGTAERSIRLPFSIDSEEPLSPGEIVGQIKDNPDIPLTSIETDSPGVRKRLAELEIDRLRGLATDWEAVIISIFRRR